jgi:hypothetical protein
MFQKGLDTVYKPAVRLEMAGMNQLLAGIQMVRNHLYRVLL